MSEILVEGTFFDLKLSSCQVDFLGISAHNSTLIITRFDYESKFSTAELTSKIQAKTLGKRWLLLSYVTTIFSSLRNFGTKI